MSDYVSPVGRDADGFSSDTPADQIIERLKIWTGQQPNPDDSSSRSSPSLPRRDAPAAAPYTPLPRRSRKEQDEDERLKYHPDVKVVHEDDAGTSYAVNKNWIANYAELHKGLVELSQLLYDIAPRVLSGEMSTTEYMNNIHKNIVEDDIYSCVSLTINRDILKRYSGRHKLILSGGPSIGEKRNWVKKQACSLRNSHPGLTRFTTAVQVEHVANDMMRALRLETPEERLDALRKLPDSFKVDTRGKLGRPRDWLGFPINPPQNAIAYFRFQNNRWVLWIANTATDHPQLSAKNRPEDGNRDGL